MNSKQKSDRCHEGLASAVQDVQREELYSIEGGGFFSSLWSSVKYFFIDGPWA